MREWCWWHSLWVSAPFSPSKLALGLGSFLALEVDVSRALLNRSFSKHLVGGCSLKLDCLCVSFSKVFPKDSNGSLQNSDVDSWRIVQYRTGCRPSRTGCRAIHCTDTLVDASCYTVLAAEHPVNHKEAGRGADLLRKSCNFGVVRVVDG